MNDFPTGDGPEWARAREGSERDFTALFDRHRDRVNRHALLLTASRHDAEDVTAAAFFELWRRRHSVRIVDNSILPWLLVTATNFARNNGRSRRRYDDLIRGLARQPPEQLPQDLWESEDTQPRLQAAINSLSPKDAALLALVAIEGMKVSEAGRALGLSDGAARVRLLRAKKRARQHLEVDPHLYRTEPASPAGKPGKASA